jgi:enamine deaminase RidA (YjgF/YER057c/UK114 family)
MEGYLQTAAGFQEHAKVLDGASDLFHQVLGERGAHTRAVFGVGSLPLDAPIEIVVTACIKKI